MPNKFNIETWQYTFIQRPPPPPHFLFSAQPATVITPGPPRRSHSAFYLLLALRADIIILECLCVDKLTKRNSFLSCCSSLASSSSWSSVFFIVVDGGIVIIFYAKSNKVNKNIAKKNTHTQSREEKKSERPQGGLALSCLVFWSATLATWWQ